MQSLFYNRYFLQIMQITLVMGKLFLFFFLHLLLLDLHGNVTIIKSLQILYKMIYN